MEYSNHIVSVIAGSYCVQERVPSCVEGTGTVELDLVASLATIAVVVDVEHGRMILLRVLAGRRWATLHSPRADCARPKED